MGGGIEPAARPDQALGVWKKYHGGRGTPAAAADLVRHYCEKEFKVRVDAVRGRKQCFVFPPPPTATIGRGPAAPWVTWTGSARALSASPPQVTPGPDGVRCRLRLAPTGFEPTDVRFEYATLQSAGTSPVAAVNPEKWDFELTFPVGTRGSYS